MRRGQVPLLHFDTIECQLRVSNWTNETLSKFFLLIVSYQNNLQHFITSFLSSPKDMLINFREREGKKRERGREPWMWERVIDQLPPCTVPDWGQTHNLDMCHDQKLNPWPFGPGDDAPTVWATLARIIFKTLIKTSLTPV